ncbi:uncharacterized protein TNCV_1134791 [Trichonephila clavipes]|nr:uncharacterized protein TNCV_1134791 [Trichonephila clavipes]
MGLVILNYGKETRTTSDLTPHSPKLPYHSNMSTLNQVDPKKRLQAAAFESYILWRNFVPQSGDKWRYLSYSWFAVRAVTRFLWAKNVSVSAMSRQHVAKLSHSFQSGRQDVESRNMTGSSRPSSSVTEMTTAGIGEMIQNDRRVNLLEISSDLGLSYGSVQHVVSDVLGYSKTVLRNHPPRPGSMDKDLISTKMG